MATSDDVRVDQVAVDEYAVHQFKDYIGATGSFRLHCELRTTIAPTISPVVLQTFNRTLAEWETVATNDTDSANTDFVIEADIDLNDPSVPQVEGVATEGETLTALPAGDYVDASDVIACRIYQLMA